MTKLIWWIITQLCISGMSIFEQIPESRSCEQAGVTADLCMRGTWKEMSVDSLMAERAAVAVLNMINNEILKEYHRMCQQLTFDLIINAQEIIEGTEGNNSTACASHTVAVMLQVKQNQARFDSRVVLLCDGSAQVVVYPIRINRYGHTASCSQDEFIRYYCYCRQQWMWIWQRKLTVNFNLGSSFTICIAE